VIGTWIHLRKTMQLIAPSSCHSETKGPTVFSRQVVFLTSTRYSLAHYLP
jgi:hypothetical protein